MAEERVPAAGVAILSASWRRRNHHPFLDNLLLWRIILPYGGNAITGIYPGSKLMIISLIINSDAVR